MSRLILYNNTKEHQYLETMIEISLGMICDKESDYEKIDSLVGHILEVSEKMGFKGNLWYDYLAYILSYSENAFSLSCERKGYVEGGINRAAIHDFDIFVNGIYYS